jgi:predicted metal-dependent phosphoesterase TrpH
MGLNGVAITDHDRIDAALKIAREIKDFLIIPGVEISSLDGHIIGLNIQEIVPKGLSAEETVDKIHEFGGLAIACHPRAALKASLRQRAIRKFDAIEVINASAFPFKRSVEKARKIATEFGLSQVGGSDAHYAQEIGNAYTLVDAELDCDSVAKAIGRGLCQPLGRAIPLKVRFKRELLALKVKLLGRKQIMLLQ